MVARPVIIISGPPGAGKTTLAAELTARFELGVHLATDFFYTAIRSGRIDGWKPESQAQNTVVVTAAARSAGAFADAGYAVIIDGVVLPWAFAIYKCELNALGFEPRLVVLLPPMDEVLRRGLSRPDQYGMDEGVYREMHRQFEAAFADDNGALVIREQLSVAQLADAVLGVN